MARALGSPRATPACARAVIVVSGVRKSCETAASTLPSAATSSVLRAASAARSRSWVTRWVVTAAVVRNDSNTNQSSGLPTENRSYGTWKKKSIDTKPANMRAKPSDRPPLTLPPRIMSR